MVTKSVLADALALPPGDRIELIDKLWEGLRSDPTPFPLSDRQRHDIDRRSAEMDANPDLGPTWEEVKARVQPNR